jgi:glycosyltransferase involved in cell wall biosynthesis
LSCFGDDYNDKIIFVENNNPLNIARKINEILILPESELREIAAKAYLYVVQNKNWKNQCEKILNFMRNN